MNPTSFYLSDPWLKPFGPIIDKRIGKCLLKERHLAGSKLLSDFALGHHYYGLHKDPEGWIFREWAPNATAIFLTGPFSSWKEKNKFMMNRINAYGDWEIVLPSEILNHGDLYKLSVHWSGGKGERIPSYATRLVQDEVTKIFSAQVWLPERGYDWEIKDFEIPNTAPVIYEAHIGMATSSEKVGSYGEFTRDTIPFN
jgi:1,4-alpha-glucan branching enzyme